MKIVIAAALLALASFAPQEEIQPARELDQHAWLQQLVGEWNVTADTTMPDGASTTWESTESVRPIGGLWVVAEGTADYGEQSFTSLMTMGYDPNKGTFVGTWIDTMQTTLWSYVGHLDESGRVLTLEAEGPAFGDPGKTARYRDQIEIVGPDHKRMVSSVQGGDGTWTTFMTMDARRAQ